MAVAVLGTETLYNVLDNLKGKKVRRIYIAAPYDAPDEEGKQANVDRVTLAAVRLAQRGFLVFAPHLSHYIALRAEKINETIPRDYWLNWGLRWLELCDAMVVLDLSEGVKWEIRFAKRHHIPVYFSLQELYRASSLDRSGFASTPTEGSCYL